MHNSKNKLLVFLTQLKLFFLFSKNCIFLKNSLDVSAASKLFLFSIVTLSILSKENKNALLLIQ